MKYEPYTLYHLYNQGNNRIPIFYTEANYLYFLRKMRTHILPFADILCYCLMPNHFHWLIHTKPESCVESNSVKAITKWRDTLPVIENFNTLPQEEKVNLDGFQQVLSHEIKTMLGSYSKAINRQEGRSGSLFRAKTKAKNGIIDGLITIDGRNKDLFFLPENNYARTCFHYIHKNPPEAGLVKLPTDWRYSSAKDYAQLRNGTLCNQALAKQLLF